MEGQCDTLCMASTSHEQSTSRSVAGDDSNLEALQVFPSWLLVQKCLWQSIPHWYDAIWERAQMVVRSSWRDSDSAQTGADGAVLGLSLCDDVAAWPAGGGGGREAYGGNLRQTMVTHQFIQ